MEQGMVVTKITELSKNRCKIYIDEEFAFVLYKGELRLYHMAEGKEISLMDYEEIQHTLLPKRAKLRAMNLLQKRSYTEKQLRDKLAEGFYPNPIIEEAVNYVKSFHYVDDYQYARDYIECYEGRKARKKVEAELLTKGISKDILQSAYEDWEASGGNQDEVAMIQEYLEKKQYSEESDLKEKKRIYGFLLRKGFAAEHVQEAMRMY